MSDPLPLWPGRPGPTLFEACVRVFRLRRYSPKTQKAYLPWIGRFIRFCGGQHPLDLDEEDVNRFLTYLAKELKVAAATQAQALSALLFLYRYVLERPLNHIDGIVRARKPKRLPEVLSHEEAMQVLGMMEGVPRLVGLLLYGAGLRLSEALELRVKDVDFVRREITVRAGKGDRDRRTMLPVTAITELRAHLIVVKQQHDADLHSGLGRVPMPNALARKYPNADREWCWQRVFPATRHYTDKQTGVRHRHHLHETVVQRAVRAAALASGIPRRITPHTFRHSFATHLMENGYTVQIVQELMGHKSLSTTLVYIHVLNRGGLSVRSPLDLPSGGAGAPGVPGASYADREGFKRTRPEDET